MPLPKTSLASNAAKLCEKYPDAPSLTLAKRLAKELGVSQEVARSAVRRLRGNNGTKSKATAQFARPNGKAGQKRPQMPKSKAEAWTPFELDNSQNIGVISDLHIPWHSELAVEAAVVHLQKQKIDTLLINGDYGDWYGMSRFVKHPKEKDEVGELYAQREGIAWLRECFPKARIVFKAGNHDERWDLNAYESHSRLALEDEMSLGHWLHFDKYGVEYVTDQRPVLAGKLAIFHGHELGKSGIANPVNPARGAFLRAQDTVLVGHSHQTSSHADTTWRRKEVMVWSTGCLCSLTPRYARCNKWNWGFCQVRVHAEGEFDVSNYRINQTGVVRAA